MFQDWELGLWAARSTGWASWAECSGMREALGKELQMGEEREAPAALGTPGWEVTCMCQALFGLLVLLGVDLLHAPTWHESMPPCGYPAHKLWLKMAPGYHWLLLQVLTSMSWTLASCRISAVFPAASTERNSSS